MSMTEFFVDLIRRGVQFQVDGDQLTIRAPKDVLTLEERTRLSQQKEQILALLQDYSRESIALHPCSYGQRALWFLYRLATESSVYNMMTAVRVRSEIDIPTLQSAFQALVDRHPCLRTTYAEISGEPVQLVHQHMEAHIEVTEASAWSNNKLENYIARIADRPIDLEKGPVLRVNLFRRSAKEHVLLLTVHHILFDFWSLEVLLDELPKLYKAVKNDAQTPLFPLTLQYSDYVRWQAEMLTSSKGQQLWAYWQQQLAGELPVLSLPTDRPRPPVQTYSGASDVAFTLDANLTLQLKALAQAEAVTLYASILAAFKLLLYRYTAQADILIGSAVAGRSQAGFEGIIGYFVNTVVMRTDLSDDPTFKTFLRRVSRVVLDALEYADYPFPLLVEKLEPIRDPSRPPLYQVAFAWDKSRLPETQQGSSFALGETVPKMDLNELELEYVAGGQRGAEFDLTLTMFEQGERLSGFWRYNTDLFDASTISRMASHFQSLLAGIVVNPEQRLSELPLLTDAEQQQLLVDWNDTKTDYPHYECVHVLFEAQVVRSPDGVAVVSDGERLTYRELNRRANQLASCLHALGAGPDTLVGICMERSIEIVIGILAILKAGGAYVPLDPTYPKERLAFMLADTQAPVILAQSHLVERLPKHQAKLLCIDADWERIAQESEENLLIATSADSPAYVMYTSGSTGQPKGIVVPHRAINRLVISTNYIELEGEDQVAFASNTAFDAATFEIWGALLNGAQLVVLDQDAVLSPHDLAAHIGEQGITALFLTTALFNQLAQQIPHAFETLNHLLFGGESVDPRWVREVLRKGPPQRLLHVYGPTESTTFTTWYLVERVSEEATTVPIGRPITNTQTYILDQNLQPVPVGVPGELYIGGDGLALGYHNRPELTTERFISNPFSDRPEARLYKTGDLVRYLPDGNIEFLGRIDDQIKLRGFRIELGEIEATLDQHPAIRQSVVLLREDRPGEKWLAGYLVPEPDQAPTVAELRSYLKDKLPEYMVPSAFMLMEALPINPNGKVDRRALPAPDPTRPELEVAFVAPRTSVEQTLVHLWEQALGLEQVGIYDNFFELGGDSILSLQIVARANQSGLQLAVKQLFQYQTIAELAAQVGTVSAVQAEQGPVTGPVPLTPIQHWFFAQELPEPHHFNQAIMLELNQPVEPALLAQALKQLLSHHDALRLRYTCQQEQWQQAIAELEEPIPLSRVDLATLPAEKQQVALETKAAEIQASLNLSQGPLLRAVLFERGPGLSGWLLLVIHHLAVDGVSWRILLEDLQSVYGQLKADQPIALPPKTTSFKAWARHLSDYSHSEALRTEAPYWQEERWHQVSSLPVDYPDGLNTAASARTISVSLSRAETTALLQEVPPVYNTRINDVLLTALGQAVVGWYNCASLLLSLEGHGREELFEGVDLSRTIGWFTALFPVLLHLEADEEPVQALKSVKEQLRAIPNRGIGYGLLRYLGVSEIAEALRALPQAQISFNYLGQFDQLLADDAPWGLLREAPGPVQSQHGQRPYLLEINGLIRGGQLWLHWTYSRNLHRSETVEKLAEAYLSALRRLIAYCQSPEAGGYTPSDFPLAHLNQAVLDRLVAREPSLADIYPLSPMQQGMLFHTLAEPETGVYFEQLVGTFDTALDVAAFKWTWQQVLDRHPILRTSFVLEGLDSVLQVVHQQTGLPWQEHDWRRLPVAEQPAEIDHFLQADRRRGFELSQPPLMRLALIRLADETYRFIWSFHHLLLDGWSVALILKEVFAGYEAFRTGQTLPLEQSRPYRDYIARLQQQDLDQTRAFWQETLAGLTAPTPLEVGRVSGTPSDTNQVYDERGSHLSAASTAALSGWAREHQLTLNALVQGAWALLLSRYSGEQDVIFGMTVSGRSAELAGIEDMVGIFINTLPMRLSVSPEEAVLPWLKRLQAWQAELGQYEHSSLVQIHGWSEIPPELPMFESILVFENYPVDTALLETAESLMIEDVQAIERTNYPLSVAVVPAEQLHIKIIYDRRRFEAATIERMLGHLQILLEGLIADAKRHLGEVPVLTESERHQLLVGWNETNTAYPKDQCVHRLFETQVACSPEALAIVSFQEQLTYGELNRQANQLAHYLQGLGVKPGDFIGICMDRSVELVVGTLAILKTGGTYVPLDPTYPKERLSFMLADTQTPVILVQQHLVEQLPEHQAQVVCFEADWEEIARERDDNPVHETTAQALAYVMYTSGSTGRPKGIAVPHRAINRLVINTNYIELGPEDRVAFASNSAFDAATFELWGALLNGARLIVVSKDVALSAHKLASLIRKQGITTLFLTTALFNQFAREVPNAFQPLRHLLFGGEAVDPQWVRTVLQKGRPERLLHVYGPTESTTFTTWHLVEAVAENAKAVPIGRPIANTQTYVLDANLRPVPIGVPGELYIGGDGLAQGYYKHPQLTKERFIPHPFSEVPGACLYKTGDLVRYLTDGSIEFLGRIDHQVKMRGFRIELGEIETLLNQHQAVQETVVLLREDVPGDKRLAAYVVSDREQPPSIAELRSYLKEKLPEYMVPSAFVFLAALPLTPNGKIDRGSLPEPETIHRGLETTYVAPHSKLEKLIANIWQEVLNVEKVGIHDNFFDLGGHSLLIIQVHNKLQEVLNRELAVADLFQYSTIDALSKHLSHEPEKSSRYQVIYDRIARQKEIYRQQIRQDIAIVGLSGRFPKAKSVDEFWQNLRDGLECISFFSDQELEATGIDPVLIRHPNYVKANGILEDVDLFDASFFDFNPRGASLTDPQHRLFLECAWEALENAGYDPETYPDLIGVYAGSSTNTYLWNNIHPSLDAQNVADHFKVTIGNDHDFLATRVSYKLNLKGPSINVQTACSTSLVAVQLACQGLLNNQCDIALAGGVSIRFPQKVGYLYQEGMILSPDGRCRAFDAKAQGAITGHGIGIVVLKRLADALADGDQIHAVIKGAAVNNDGSLKVGYTAPGVEGQAEVIATAQALAGVDPETITYIETHGTGTPLGDPTEISALTQAFQARTDKNGFCAIGSVKTNVGHLDAAAGVAGLIKTVLALKHKQLPPSLHFEQANPEIDFTASPFYVNTKLTEWQTGPTPRRAGVSSFGIGGTNAHLVLEEAPLMKEASAARRPWQLLVLSAKTATTLEAMTENLAAHLEQHPALILADVAYTLQVGRGMFRHRRMLVCRDLDDAIDALETMDPSRVLGAVQEAKDKPVVFMFPGQGAQYVEMAAELYQVEPIFREHVDRCAELLKPQLGLDLRKVLYPGEEQAQAEGQLGQTYLTQPALFVIEYALAQLWLSWGVKPQAMIGHSIGEYVAACLAGVFSLEEALTLVAARGRLMQQLPPGAMLAVFLPEAEVEPYLNDHLSMAVINSPKQGVVSGPPEAIEALQRRLTAEGVGCRRLETSHAFHSAMMEPMLDAFRQQVERITLNPPQIPFVSNVSGTWLATTEATDPGYWANHLRQTVRFNTGLDTLLQEPGWVLLEVGPGQTLSTLARHHPAKTDDHTVLSSLPRPNTNQSEATFLMTVLGQLWLAGVKVDWSGLYSEERRQRLPLPTYPFERQRYWIEALKQSTNVNGDVQLLAKKPDIADWFYVPSWKRSIMPKPFAPDAVANQVLCWLIFSDEWGLGASMIKRLEQAGQEVIRVQVGERFSRVSDSVYTINPQTGDDYDTLLTELRLFGKIPNVIMHLWSLTPDGHPEFGLETVDRVQDLGLYSLLFLAQTIGRQFTHEIQLGVISNNVQDVTGKEMICPAKATILGPCKIIPQEYPNISCRTVDIELADFNNGSQHLLVTHLLAEFLDESLGSVVAYRGDYRWVQTFEPVRLDEAATEMSRIRESGVYLITGGLGGIGLVVAEHLAKMARARLILIGRSTFPARDEWEQWLATHDKQDDLSRKIRKLQEIEALGAETLVLSADVSNLSQMESVITLGQERFGLINGVIHSAGLADYAGFIQRRSREVTKSILAPKVRGTLVLDTLLSETQLDFFVLCSTLGSLLPQVEFGQVGYCAANEFLDAFTYYRNRRDGQFTVTINWTSWQEVGMAEEARQRQAQIHPHPVDSAQDSLLKGLYPAEGADVFQRIVASTFPRVVVSTQNLSSLIEQIPRFGSLDLEEVFAENNLSKPTHPRPDLSNAYVAPRNEREASIASIWQNLLGVEPIGIHDNFFELGGDSLMIIQAHSNLQEQFGAGLSIGEMFQYPTISTLVKHLSQEQDEEPLDQQLHEQAERQRMAFARQKRLMMKQKGVSNE